MNILSRLLSWRFWNLDTHVPFTSDAITWKIQNVTASIKDPELARLFETCFAYTTNNLIAGFDPEVPDTSISTGDIEAMWLRDSAAQTSHLFPLLKEYEPRDTLLASLLDGLLLRQAKSILIDGYANAFTFDPSEVSADHSSDQTKMAKGVFERKFEVDSLTAFLKLSNLHAEYSDSETRKRQEWIDAISSVLNILEKLQRLDYSKYKFQRNSLQPSESLEYGQPPPGKVTGMIPSAFRPSDDACVFPFNIPVNAELAVELDKLVVEDLSLKSRASNLSHAIRRGIESFGKVDRGDGKIFAYEVDGFGGALIMDDANLPSLLSLPLSGYCNSTDPDYLRTRAVILSADSNPWYFEGSQFRGVGSVHTGRDRIWPLSLMAQYLTSSDDLEKESVMNMLRLSADDVFHESVHVNNASDFTRKSFGWANSFFVKLLLN